jgi:Leucine-rich repeat (LRR) protein
MRAATPRAPRRAGAAPSRRAAAAAPDHHHARAPPPPTAATARDPPSPSELAVRIDLAASTGRLDLSECGLEAVPTAVLSLGAGLTDLSLAGNGLRDLPPDLGAALPSLSRLQLAGNELATLPESVTLLTGLEGLWVHGNALTALPAGLGALTALRALSAAGNNLTHLPPSFGDLASLEDAALGGNALSALPDTLAGLTSLRKLALHGNRLEGLPPSIGALPALSSLALQGNRLTSLPAGAALAGLTALESLNIADNALTELPAVLASLPRLKAVTAYGNALTAVPPELVVAGGGGGGGSGESGARAGPALWLEGNPLDAGALAAALNATGPSSGPAIGLDTAQAAALAAVASGGGGGAAPITTTPPHPRVRVSTRAAAAPGYWKLDVGPPGAPGAGTAPGDAVTDASGRPASGGRALVIAFGSAPGEPNWGGLLGRLRAGATAPGSPCGGALAAFDVLYVVDPWRSWYDGEWDEFFFLFSFFLWCVGGWRGREKTSTSLFSLVKTKITGGGPGYETWASHLAAAAAPYDGRILLLGDSMGATAALMFGGVAAASPRSAILAFCPQLDLGSSAIRPAGVPGDATGTTAAWRDALRDRALAGAAAASDAGARVAVHVGSWLHDVDQAAWLENPSQGGGPTVKVWGVSTHRLAATLDGRGELLPLVRGPLAGVMGVKSGDGVRVANVL